jgi:hypothetical protein
LENTEALVDNLKLLIEQLKAEGITPKVTVTVSVGEADIQTIKSAQSRLQEAGITPEIQINVGVGDVMDLIPEGTEDIPAEKSIPVVVNADKTNCVSFTRLDKSGKPIMEIREPRVQLFRGDRLSVSAVHKAGEKDPGDGTIIGTGGFKYYFIVDCPTRREAEGLYLKQSDVFVV